MCKDSKSSEALSNEGSIFRCPDYKVLDFSSPFMNAKKWWQNLCVHVSLWSSLHSERCVESRILFVTRKLPNSLSVKTLNKRCYSVVFTGYCKKSQLKGEQCSLLSLKILEVNA